MTARPSKTSASGSSSRRRIAHEHPDEEILIVSTAAPSASIQRARSGHRTRDMTLGVPAVGNCPRPEIALREGRLRSID